MSYDESYTEGFRINDLFADLNSGKRTDQWFCIFSFYIHPEIAEQPTTEQLIERMFHSNRKVIKQIEESLGLDFTPKKIKGNLCFANNNEELRDDFKSTFTPTDLLNFIYAVLHSPIYGKKYEELLQLDFPSVPFPKDAATFWQLTKLGAKIRQIHLLQSTTSEKYGIRYPVGGNNLVNQRINKNSLDFVPTKNGLGKVYVNENQYFENIPQVAWEFHFGEYQPAKNWLRNKAGTTLNLDDILHYQKIIIALFEINKLSKEIDKIEI